MTARLLEADTPLEDGGRRVEVGDTGPYSQRERVLVTGHCTANCRLGIV